MDIGHALRVEAGVSFVWTDLPPLVERLEGVPQDVKKLQFCRNKASHKGVSRLSGLTHLWAHKVDQDMLGEIARLPALEMLFIRGTRARDLAPLAGNRALRRLIVIGGTKIEDYEWVRGLPEMLEVLFLEGFFRAQDLAPLSSLPNLTSLGVEGGMDTSARLDTLQPLASLHKLRYLFLANTRVADKSLAPLQQLKNLQRLESSIHFPDAEFIALKQALPGLDCDWIEMIDRHGSLHAAMAAVRERLRRR